MGKAETTCRESRNALYWARLLSHPMANSSSSSSSGISLSGLLGIAFVVLKLTGHITWPWIWVTAPFWIPVAILVVALIVVGVGVLISALLDK